jgi:hypothetical protein
LIINAFHPKYMEIETLYERIQEISRKKIPLLVSYVLKDSLISERAFLDLIRYLFIRMKDENFEEIKKDFDIHDSNGQLEERKISDMSQKIFDEQQMKIIAFKYGKHFAHNTHHGVINREIVLLIGRIK